MDNSGVYGRDGDSSVMRQKEETMMDRIAFVMSMILTFLGIVILAWTRAVKALLPKIGWIVFKASGPGSYSPGKYEVDLSGVSGIATVCIIAGIVMSVILYRRGRKQ